jgi:pimeloyl-ACP methyl ester carboxylesterase
MTLPPEPWTHREAVVNQVRLHYVEAGAGPLVVLLHGFPEFWYSWRHQIPALAQGGFHVVAPDLRGYNESDKPIGVRNYRLPVLVGDVVALIESFGAGRAFVVGHDWGGVIAWVLAMRRPDVVERLVTLNAPHPAAYYRELWRNPRQWLRSWYILLFQLPWLPEWMLRRGNYALLQRMLQGPVTRPGAFSDEDVERYRRALEQPGARTAIVNYYRALVRHGRGVPRTFPPIAAPTLVLWGERDAYLGVGLTRGLDRWVPHLRVERLPDAGHWLQVERPDEVNRHLLAFLHGVGA